MTGYKAGLKGGMDTPYSKGQALGNTAAPSIKVGYSDGKKESTQTNRNGDPDSSHGK